MAKSFRSRQDKRAYHTTIGRIQKRKDARDRMTAIGETVLGQTEPNLNPTMKDVKEAARSILSF